MHSNDRGGAGTLLLLALLVIAVLGVVWLVFPEQIHHLVSTAVSRINRQD